jgi:aminoglycoside phosphotransferase (APT) family kinase protein
MTASNVDVSYAEDEFDPLHLDGVLRTVFPDLAGDIQIERIAGGQSNPTFFVTYPGRRLVLRKQPPGELLPSAHAIDREYRVMKALGTTDVPVPRMLFYCDDRSVVGTPFYIMERLEGRVFHDCALPSVPIKQRIPMYRSLAQALAKLHNVSPHAVGLEDYGKAGNYFSRQIARWTRQWELSQTRDDRNIQQLIEWLPAHVPTDDTTAVAHGDYRVGNVMFHPQELRIVGILDWELSTLGHPLADLAHSCIAWHSLPDEYGGLKGLDLRTLGIPEQKEYEDMYYGSVQHGLRMTGFHMAFALFRWSVIFEGIAARAKAGNAADANASRTGHLSAHFAQRAVDVLDRP